MPFLSKIRLNGTLYDLKVAGDAMVTGVKGDAESDYRVGDVNITPEDIGTISTQDTQSLTDTQKSTARDNLGLGSAATRSVPASGNANATQVVLGSDTRLTGSYKTDDSASTTINDTDYVPMSESDGTKKKTLWSTIIAKIKSVLGKSDVGLGNVANLDQSKAIKSITRSGTTFTATALDGTTSTFTQQDNNTTYPVYNKIIDANYKTSYRTETGVSSGPYISSIRNNTASVDSAPQFGSGMAWGMSDTHGYLNTSYNSADAYIGGGNAGKLNWTNRICLSPFDLAVSGSSYGYKKTDGTFVAFRKPTGNATAAQVLSGYTASNASSDGFSGSMPDNSTRTSNGNVPGVNSNYSTQPVRTAEYPQFATNTDGVVRYIMCPPKGYYPGVGSSYIGEVASNFGNATAGDVISGKTFTSQNGKALTGSFKHAATKTPTGSELNTTALNLGEQHTYRYVNTAVCYNAGRTSVTNGDSYLYVTNGPTTVLSDYVKMGNAKGFYFKPDAPFQGSPTIEFLEWGTWNVIDSYYLQNLPKYNGYYFKSYSSNRIGLVRIQFAVAAGQSIYYHYTY